MSTHLLAVLLVVLLILAGILFFGGEENLTPEQHTMPNGTTMENQGNMHIMPDGSMMHY